ncbi:RNA polymerase recycling motor HelD [Thermobrachium celere]|uniref:DNA 3'-5' helicase n=1 Tax=Thermobrachium celere DSM 8682 TaxID=941824 RepID=R7RN10_9CLOT|nr:RNA polymerase recycling motor HelD [Thermobrachium celere]CDF57542.1 superfamily I DNA helicase [Thermobrachium celere DSM 8682]
MPIEKHPDFQEELKYLDFILSFLKIHHKRLLATKAILTKELSKGIGDPKDDSSDPYISMLINTQLSDTLEEKLEKIEHAHKKPYFARVDFTEDGSKNREKLYIGKMCVLDDKNFKPYIIDWRAPIANLYYEGRLGKAHYVCPDGKIYGEIHLKRQYTIEEGKLRNILDIDITTNDEFLQAFLSANADNRLKDIVSTIQVEQNRIIRADMWKPLIVQGVAGSGKTTIALHRIAYLIYNYDKDFVPENYMIIAPNKLFLNYISEVLPELGVNRVKQTTFEEFAFEVLERKIKLKDVNNTLSLLVNLKDEKQKNIIVEALKFKTSKEFWDILDKYLKQVEYNLIPDESFKIGKIELFSHNEINELFLKNYSDLPFAKRLNEIKKHLQNRAKLKKDELIEKLNKICDVEISKIKNSILDLKERQAKITETYNKRDELIGKVNDFVKSGASNYIKHIKIKTAFEYYDEFLLSDMFKENALNYISNDAYEYLISTYIENKKSDLFEYEDLAPLLYIKYKTLGLSEKIKVKHIVIDEAQDFSVLQLHVLKNIIKDSSFTILGDLNQGIHYYRGVRNWNDIKELVFNNTANYLTLEQTYRTSIEIMDVANKVISYLKESEIQLAKPVIRHGDKVQIKKVNSYKDVVENIASDLEALKNSNIKSIAIIGKTLEECKEIHKMLKIKGYKFSLITGNEKDYSSKLVVVPSYLSKGLEFDAVYIPNASSSLYQNNELDIKLLYVALTRPLHKLCIYSIGEVCDMLKFVSCN